MPLLAAYRRTARAGRHIYPVSGECCHWARSDTYEVSARHLCLRNNVAFWIFVMSSYLFCNPSELTPSHPQVQPIFDFSRLRSQ